VALADSAARLATHHRRRHGGLSGATEHIAHPHSGLMKTSYLVESYCSAIALKNENCKMQNAKSFLENPHFAILILHFPISQQRNKHEAHHLL